MIFNFFLSLLVLFRSWIIKIKTEDEVKGEQETQLFDSDDSDGSDIQLPRNKRKVEEDAMLIDSDESVILPAKQRNRK